MAAIPHLIVDDFLPVDLHRDLLEHVLANDDFAPARVFQDGAYCEAPDFWRSRVSDAGLGDLSTPFRQAIESQFDAICAGLGMAPFPRAEFEVRLVAHGDGDFFVPHRDTFTGKDRAVAKGDRAITVVFYFHRQPRGFTGGDLRLHPIGDGAPLVVEPRDNRLVAFPSFLTHEVLPIAVPDGDVANSRFSVSCWFSRIRPDVPVSGASDHTDTQQVTQ